jgi:hypothetical protein
MKNASGTSGYSTEYTLPIFYNRHTCPDFTLSARSAQYCSPNYITNMKALWDTAPCSLVLVDRRFRGVYYLHHLNYGDGGSTHVWNVGLVQRGYTALYPRRLTSLFSPPWESEISQIKLRFSAVRALWVMSTCYGETDAISQNVIWSENTSLAVPLNKPRRNEPNQNHCYGVTAVKQTERALIMNNELSSGLF